MLFSLCQIYILTPLRLFMQKKSLMFQLRTSLASPHIIRPVRAPWERSVPLVTVWDTKMSG